MTKGDLIERRYRKVQAAWRAGLPALTVVRARSFLKRYPEFGPAWGILGVALTEIANEAEQALRRAIALCPDKKRWIPLGQMGHLCQNRGDYGRAERWFHEVIEAAPEDATGYIYLGAVVALQGRLEEAEAIHRRATHCTDGCLDEAHHNLGLVLRAQGRYVEAMECFAHALALTPDYRAAKQALRDVRRILDDRRRSGEIGQEP